MTTNMPPEEQMPAPYEAPAPMLLALLLTHEELHALHNIILMESLALAKDSKGAINQKGRLTPSMQLVLDRQILRLAAEIEMVASIREKIRMVTPVKVPPANSLNLGPQYHTSNNTTINPK